MLNLFRYMENRRWSSIGIIEMWPFVWRELYQTVHVQFLKTKLKWCQKRNNTKTIFKFIINRWIRERPKQLKCCPTCKKTARLQDLQILYAQRVVATDNSTEYRLREQLEIEMKRNIDLQIKLSAKCHESNISHAGRNVDPITESLLRHWYKLNECISSNQNVEESKSQMKRIEKLLLDLRKIDVNANADVEIEKYRIDKEYELKERQLNRTR